MGVGIESPEENRQYTIFTAALSAVTNLDHEELGKRQEALG